MLKPFSLSLNMSNSLFVLLGLFYVISKCAGNCVIYNETKRENELLNKLKLLYGSTFEDKDEHYTYKISICDQIKGQQADAGAVQIEDKKSPVTLGKYTDVTIMGGTDWILLTYKGGEKYNKHCSQTNRTTNIMIVCDPDNLKGSFEIIEENRKYDVDSCYYLFELSSSVSCTIKPPEHVKLSSGSVFCILFFTVVSVYLICGVLYKRIVIGAKGMEQIPNYTFWRDFGNLQADGCDYFCRWGSRHDSQAYRGIDEHLKEEEERDDQLLNM